MEGRKGYFRLRQLHEQRLKVLKVFDVIRKWLVVEKAKNSSRKKMETEVQKKDARQVLVTFQSYSKEFSTHSLGTVGILRMFLRGKDPHIGFEILQTQKLLGLVAECLWVWDRSTNQRQ